MPKSINKSYIYAVFAVCIWGTTFALSKFVVPDALDPIMFTTLRTMIGFSVLFLYLVFTHQIIGWITSLKSNWKTYALIGCCVYSMAYIIQYWGISHTTAINQSILSNTQSFWIIVLNFALLKRKPAKKFIPGMLVALIGVLLILLNDEFRISQETIKGDLISLLAFFFWALYSFTTKPITTKEKPIFVTTSIIFFGNVVLIPTSAVLGGFAKLPLLSGTQWLIMIYMGVFAIGFSFIFWNTALSDKDIPSENTVIITMLNPMVGIITSILFLGEILTLRIAIGCILVFASVFFVNYSKKK